MTEDQRTISPIIIPEKQMIYAVKTYDGTSNIVASSLDTIIFKPVTKYDNGIQILSLTYDSDKQVIWYDAVEHHTRNLYSYSIKTNKIETQEAHYDHRDPYSMESKLVYSSDKTGIFNIFIEIGIVRIIII